MDESSEAALEQRLRDYIAAEGFDHNERLPPERSLAAAFGVGRAPLRRALAALEREGLIWRHVGRGTFIGARPVLNMDDVAYLGGLVSPAQVMEARLALEPELARIAAVRATPADIEALRVRSRRCVEAGDWRGYEARDNLFHHAVAGAARNKLLMHLFETLNVVRRTIVWSQRRETQRPPADHFSFAQHEAIVEAIARRDAAEAAAAMRAHIATVREKVLPALSR